MEKRPLFTLLGLLAAAGAFADAYTWTDDNGIVHYSDRPNPGAKKNRAMGINGAEAAAIIAKHHSTER